MPARPVGTFHYYIEVVPTNQTAFAKTYLYGTDGTQNKSALESAAAAAPYIPDLRLPAAGEIVITEVMVNARTTSEDSKEWFEVVNMAAVPLLMHGCKVGDSLDGSLHTINSPELIFWPGVYVTFGNTANVDNMEGFVPDYAYGVNIAFNNTPPDKVRVLLPTSTVIDVVDYTGWPGSMFSSDGKSMQLKTTPPSATDNDLSTRWCVSQKPYGQVPPYGTSFGTPNAVTDGCLP
jgi:hypothetical protein